MTLSPEDLQEVTRTSWALGSEVSITLLHADGELARRAVDASLAELTRVEQLLSLYRPESQLCRLNRKGVLHRPHPDLVAVLRHAQFTSQRTGGAFDVTVQPLWQVYAEAQQAGQLPEPAAVEAARQQVDWRRVYSSPERVELCGKGTLVTLNGIAQGFAADRVMDVLRRHGIRHALVNTGEIGTLGRRTDGQQWTVGIQHPRSKDAYIALARLEGRFMATSGDYETTFSEDRVYNHIFDPANGRSPQAFSSVTVIADSGTEADALSTALFVLGQDQGVRLIESIPGAEALLVLKNGRTLSTSGFPSVNI